MSMRGEIKDFISTALAVHKTVSQDENDQHRNAYYDSLVNSTNRRLDLEQQRLNQDASLRQKALGIQGAGLGLRGRALDIEEKYNNWRMDPNNPANQRNGPLVPDGGVNPPSPSNYRMNDPAFDNGTSAVPATSAAVDTEPGGQATPPAIGGYAPPNQAYDVDARADGDEDDYAQGGAVSDDDSNEPDIQHHDAPAPQQGAVSDDDQLPASSAPTSLTQSGSNPKGGTSTQGGFSVQKVLQSWGVGNQNPVKLGMDGFMRSLQGNGAVPDDNAAHPALMAIHKNQGAASDQEVAGMNKAVDPNNELDDSAKTIARLDAGVKFWLSRGEPQKAEKVAQSLILYGKMQAQQFGQQAADALKKGDTQGALNFLSRAYDQVPDGQKLQAQVDDNGQIHASTVDADGNTRDLGTFGAPQVMRLVLGAQNGTEYMNRIATIAAGGRGGSNPKGGTAAAQQGQQGQGQGGGMMKPQDFQNVQGGIEDAVGKFTEANKMQLEPATAQSIKDIATHLAVDPNNRRAGMTPNEAVSATAMLAAPDKGNPDARNYKVQIVNGGAVVQFAGGQQAFVPKPQFDQLMAIRASQAKVMKDSTAKAQADAAKPGFFKTINDARDNAAPAKAAEMNQKRMGRRVAQRDFARQGVSDGEPDDTPTAVAIRD